MAETIIEDLKKSSVAGLNEWERRTVRMVVTEGHPVTNKQIAAELKIPRKQAKRVRRSIVEKLGLKKGF